MGEIFQDTERKLVEVERILNDVILTTFYYRRELVCLNFRILFPR